MSTTRKRMFRIGTCCTAALVLLVVLLDPYTRQWIFGPKIRGEPLCYRQYQFRLAVAPDDVRGTAMAKLRAFFGIKESDTTEATAVVDLPVALSLIDDANPFIRTAVAGNLGCYPKSPEAIDGLVRLLDDPDDNVRAAAAYSCGRIGIPAAPALPRLRELLEDPDALCRAQAAGAVWFVSAERPARVLAILREGLMIPRSRIAAVHQIVLIGKDAVEMFPEVIACAGSDPGWGNLIIQELECFGPGSVTCLRHAMQDPARSIRCNAIFALGNLKNRAIDAVPDLIGSLNDPDPDVRIAAGAALSKIDPGRYLQKQEKQRKQ